MQKTLLLFEKTWLLTFFHTRVASQESTFAKRGKMLWIIIDQRTCDAHFASSRLSRLATTGNGDADINAFSCASGLKRIRDGTLILSGRKVIVELLPVASPDFLSVFAITRICLYRVYCDRVLMDGFAERPNPISSCRRERKAEAVDPVPDEDARHLRKS